MSHQEVVVEFVYYAIQGTLLIGFIVGCGMMIYGGLKLAMCLSRWIRSLLK